MLEITSKDFEITDAIKTHALDCGNRILNKFKLEETKLNSLILNKENNHEFGAEFIVNTKFGNIVAKSKAEDLYQAISDAKHKAITQLQKKHDEHTKHSNK